MKTFNAMCVLLGLFWYVVFSFPFTSILSFLRGEPDSWNFVEVQTFLEYSLFLCDGGDEKGEGHPSYDHGLGTAVPAASSEHSPSDLRSKRQSWRTFTAPSSNLLSIGPGTFWKRDLNEQAFFPLGKGPADGRKASNAQFLILYFCQGKPRGCAPKRPQQ